MVNTNLELSADDMQLFRMLCKGENKFEEALRLFHKRKKAAERSDE
jgi:hypothetical protein